MCGWVKRRPSIVMDGRMGQAQSRHEWQDGSGSNGAASVSTRGGSPFWPALPGAASELRSMPGGRLSTENYRHVLVR
jgi:hypothetical protein